MSKAFVGLVDSSLLSSFLYFWHAVCSFSSCRSLHTHLLLIVMVWSTKQFADYRHKTQVASLCRQFGIDPLKVTKKTVDKAFRRLMLRLYVFRSFLLFINNNNNNNSFLLVDRHPDKREHDGTLDRFVVELIARRELLLSIIDVPPTSTPSTPPPHQSDNNDASSMVVSFLFGWVWLLLTC